MIRSLLAGYKTLQRTTNQTCDSGRLSLARGLKINIVECHLADQACTRLGQLREEQSSEMNIVSLVQVRAYHT